MSGPAQHSAPLEVDGGYFSHPVRAVPLGPPSESQLELIRAHLVDPAVLDEEQPIIVQAQASNTREDAYSTVMDRSTLDNFAADALAGVAFMNSHRTGGMMAAPELPMGRTFDGKVVGASSAGATRLDVSAYVFPSAAPNGMQGLTGAQMIEMMRRGTARDVSVGFYGGEYRCSICDRDMLRDWECRHFPGLTYAKTNAKGQEVEGETVRAVARIVGAHLAELSLVYDGATPGCMVGKAQRMVASGDLKGDAIELLEQRYRVTLPHPTRAFAGVEIPAAPAQEAEPMTLTDEQIATVRLALTETGAAPDADIPASVRALVDEAKGLRALPAEVERLKAIEAETERLRPLADEGRAYRADLVTSALSEGARAYGADFAEETYRGLLEAAPLETVKRMAADWKAVGDKTFPGGRATQDAAEPTPITGRKARPAAAYS